MRIDYAIVFVSDMPAATAFFRDVIGLPLKFETPEWTEFATEGSTLALHATGVAARPATEGDTPAGTCRTGFSVPDLRAFHERMREHQVPCLQEPTALHGTLLAQYSGPDGVVLGVSEMRKPS